MTAVARETMDNARLGLTDRLMPPLFAVLGLSLSNFPRLVPFVLILLGCVALARALMTAPRDALMAGKFWVGFWLVLLFVYLAANAQWSLDQDEATDKVLEMLPVFLATILLITGIRSFAPETARRSAFWFASALAAGSALLLFELAAGQYLAKLLYTFFPPDADKIAKHFNVVDGKIVAIPSHKLNRAVTDMVFVLWPAALLVLGAALSARDTIIAWCVLFLVVMACVALSVAGTATVALGLSALVFLIARRWFRFAQYTVAAGLVAALVLAVPLGRVPYDLGWTKVEWLSASSVRARFFIWAYTSNKTMEQPIAGIGMLGTPKLPQMGNEYRQPTRLERLRLRPSVHAHNMFLQIWLELGAIGAALFLALGVAILSAIGRLCEDARPFALAAFTTACGVGFSGFGLWQTWQFAGVLMMVVVIELGLRLLDMHKNSAQFVANA